MEHLAPVPTPEQLALWSAVLKHVARSRRLRPDEAEDFTQTANLRLVERQYDVFYRHDGRSTLRTFLTVVAVRILLDWRNHAYGKWRPSAEAVRLGDHAILLDRLIHRDGCTASEAVQIVQARCPGVDRTALLALVSRLPVRIRPRLIPADGVSDIPAPDGGCPVERAEHTRDNQRRLRAIATAVRQLSVEERRLMRLRYLDGQSVRAIADADGVDQKQLYRRFERVQTTLRRLAGQVAHT